MNIFKTEELEENFFMTSSVEQTRGISLSIRAARSVISLRKAFVISVLLHPIVLGLIWAIAKLIIYLFLIFGIHIPFIEQPVHKVRDLEFVLVNQDRTRLPVVRKISNKTSKTIMTADDSLKSRIKTNQINNERVNRNPLKSGLKPHSETVIPLAKTLHRGYKMQRKSEPDAFSIPMPKIKPLSSDIGFGANGTVGYTSPDSSPISRISSGEGAGSSGNSNMLGRGKRKGGGYSYGSGTAGLPRIGASGQSHSDELSDVDMGTYVSDLQRRVKRKWTPPKGNEDKRVSLFLRISRDGRLLVLNVKNTSGNQDTDNAAITAVKQTLPFRPLPAGYRENYLDVVLKFDYNVH